MSHPGKLLREAGLTIVQTDVLHSAALAPLLVGYDAVISAFSGHAQDDIRDYYQRGFQSILTAVKAAKVPRLLMVGGAGSLEVAPGVQLVDTADFPAQWKPTAEGARDALKLLRAEPALDWTMLCPSAHLAPGARTGKFRLGGDQLLVDAEATAASRWKTMRWR